MKLRRPSVASLSRSCKIWYRPSSRTRLTEEGSLISRTESMSPMKYEDQRTSRQWTLLLKRENIKSLTSSQLLSSDLLCILLCREVKMSRWRSLLVETHLKAWGLRRARSILNFTISVTCLSGTSPLRFLKDSICSTRLISSSRFKKCRPRTTTSGPSSPLRSETFLKTASLALRLRETRLCWPFGNKRSRCGESTRLVLDWY